MHLPGPARIQLATLSQLPLVHSLMLQGFAEYRRYPRPSSALAESVEDVQAAVAKGGALLSTAAGTSVGTARFRPDWKGGITSSSRSLIERAVAGERFPTTQGTLWFSRMTVLPAARGHGLGDQMLQWLDELARNLGLTALEATVRSQQPDNRPYYVARGFEILGYSERYGISDMVTHIRRRVFC